MPRIIGISGSLRHGSFNTNLLRAAKAVLPADAELDIGSIADFPLYNFDEETEHGIPAPVTRLKDKIANADGLLISTPEYNNSMPGVLKNAIDWLSRPGDDISRVFGDLPVAIIGATPGAFGTLLAQNAWLPVLRTLGMRHWTGGRLVVPRAAQLFDENGKLTDDAAHQRLEKFMLGFIAFARQQSPSSEGK